MAQEDMCRMAIYDKDGNFLGYKIDSFWTLTKNPEFAKIHSAGACGLEGNLIENLMHLSNNPENILGGLLGIEKTISDEGYRIDVERIGLEGTPNGIIAKYQVMKDSTGKYITTHRND